MSSSRSIAPGHFVGGSNRCLGMMPTHVGKSSGVNCLGTSMVAFCWWVVVGEAKKYCNFATNAKVLYIL